MQERIYGFGTGGTIIRNGLFVVGAAGITILIFALVYNSTGGGSAFSFKPPVIPLEERLPFDELIHIRNDGTGDTYTFVLPNGSGMYFVSAMTIGNRYEGAGATFSYSVNVSHNDRFGTYTTQSVKSTDLGWTDSLSVINTTVTVPDNAVASTITFVGYNEPGIDLHVVIRKV